MWLDRLRELFSSDWRRVDLGRTALLVLLILALAAALWQYLMPEVRTIESTTFRRVPEIRKVVDVKRVYLPCPERGIVALDKAQVAKKLDIGWLEAGDPLPGAAAAGAEPQAAPRPDLQVTATAEIPESRNGAAAVSVIDLASGETNIVVRENPAPWFQFRNDGALGLRYGLNQKLQNVGSVYGRWDFLRVKNVYLSANGTLETGGDALLQLGAEYRW